ncbi:MAG TPA: DUF4331 family protein [Gemmatimonadota bacterium]|nr:DUF4331 family protein [Gemmatimonadota bacterium]
MNGIATAGRRGALALVAAVAIGAAAFGGYRWVTAADHRDSMALTNDQAADIADVYSFLSPANPSNIVLAMTVPGLIPPSESGSTFFDPNVLYQFKIDTNGDAVENLVIQVFATGSGASQTVHFRGPVQPPVTGATNQLADVDDAVTVRISTGQDATTATGGGLTVFAGIRDDPFFFDLARFNEIVMGAAASFRDPGIDTFAGTNALAIVVELPASMLGGPQIGVWGTTSRRS